MKKLALTLGLAIIFSIVVNAQEQQQRNRWMRDTIQKKKDTLQQMKDTVQPMRDTLQQMKDTVQPMRDTLQKMKDTLQPMRDTLQQMKDTTKMRKRQSGEQRSDENYQLQRETTRPDRTKMREGTREQMEDPSKIKSKGQPVY